MTVLAPDARLVFETADHNRPTCPIWDGLKVVSFQYPSVEQNILAEGSRYYSSRAGGPFLLMPDGAALLDWESPNGEQKLLADRKRANLSYWICRHNLDNGLFDDLPNREVLQEPGRFAHWMNDHQDHVPKLGKTWVVDHRDLTPSAEDRMLTFLREMIRNTDAGEQRPDEDLLRAAGGCWQESDLKELRLYALERGWLEGGGAPGTPSYPHPGLITLGLGARIHVEEKLGSLGQERQGFSHTAGTGRTVTDGTSQTHNLSHIDGSVFDVFVCHATEDKAAVARPLAKALRDAGLRVWYDEFELKIGNSLRRKIDSGLADSRFGVVVLSPAFFGRGWPEYELNGLVAQTVSGEQALLPVWHNVTEHEVKGYSPSLIDRFALSTTTHTVEKIAAAIVDVIRNTPES